jgi:class 3 adenylate cyclase
MSVVGLQIRAGVHTGEVEVREGDLGGLAVHIGARIMGLAGHGEVLASTVKDLLAGAELEFIDRSEHELKGVPGSWHLFTAVTHAPS